MKVTENELIEACRAALLPTPDVEDAFVVTEIAGRMGVCRTVALRALRGLLEEGRAEVVKVTRTRISGVVAKTVGYRLK